jgi:predicted Zn-dependent protease
MIEVDGVEITRRSLPSFGGAQHREDFDIYANTAQQSVPPGTISAKFSHPRNEKTVPLYAKAAAAEKSKQLDKAVGYIKEIVAIDAADFIAWSILGSLYLEQNAFAESDAAFRKSLAIKIEYTPAWISVARLRIAQKQVEAAIEILKHAVSLEPQSANTYRLLGETYLQAKQGSLGVEALNEAIKLDPVGMADCHLLIARLYELAGAKNLATREYKAFLIKVPDYVEKAKLEKYVKENPE